MFLSGLIKKSAGCHAFAAWPTWRYLGAHGGRRKHAALAAFLLLAITKTASAQDIHYRYLRPNGSSLMAFTPRPSYAFIRGRVYYFSPLPQPDPPPPNTWLQFRHPFTHSYVTVPVNLPTGIPRIENRGDRVLYNYGGYSVVIHFVRDGSVDVTYQSLY